MCGILGYFSNCKAISGERFYDAHCRISHRGPDDEGFMDCSDGSFRYYYGDNTVKSKRNTLYIKSIPAMDKVMSQTRLSIMDLSDAGHQPMCDDENNISLVFNGEIYNYREVRTELEGMGYKFRSDCDTEVILFSYMCWGTECFKKFNGMWAVAIYDSRREELILSRDRFGIKPLFYYSDNGTIIFASEAKSILRLTSDIHPNHNCIREYLYNCNLCFNNETFFDRIYEVEPATTLIYTKFHARTEEYWKIEPITKKRNNKEALEEFTCLFEDSIRLRMQSDVPVGSLLSGGLDSSTIVGFLIRKLNLQETFQAFSSVYSEEEFSERSYIDKTKDELGIVVNYVEMDSDDIAERIDNTIYHTEMPTRSVSVVLQNRLYEKIRNCSGIRVVLNGQGADELFGGYMNNYYARFIELLSQVHLLRFIQECLALKKNRNLRVRDLLYGLKCNIGDISFLDNNVFNKITIRQLTAPLREYLMYDDRQSMAYGIEARAPFMDYRLVEYAFSLESDQKINRFYNKAIVREYARPYVSRDVLERKDKMGFTSPQVAWQTGPWAQILDDEFAGIHTKGLLGEDVDKIAEKYSDYRNNHTDPWIIWRYFALSRWAKAFGL